MISGYIMSICKRQRLVIYGFFTLYLFDFLQSHRTISFSVSQQHFRHKGIYASNRKSRKKFW
ncbi:hypothetical protein [Helicobacter cinaedi]|uniref:hypothetical protein n=1 Tax=Helicobacter cinaedi TaxID=213 RepID=UPI0013150998|nr:hypothetical protein [Helicobacter cinaedi]